MYNFPRKVKRKSYSSIVYMTEMPFVSMLRVKVWETLVSDFGMDDSKFADYSTISKDDQLKGYEMMQLCRQFENACNQAYMQGKIRGFMHLDNGQVRSDFRARRD